MLQGRPDLPVRVAAHRVEVQSEGPGEQDGVLGDDRDPGPELAQPQVGDVHLVDLDGAAGGLDNPEESQGEGGLASSSSANNS